jgi:hypothetical protein
MTRNQEVVVERIRRGRRPIGRAVRHQCPATLHLPTTYRSRFTVAPQALPEARRLRVMSDE